MITLLQVIGCAFGLFLIYGIIYTKANKVSNETEKKNPELPFSEFDTEAYNDEVYR